MAFDYPGPPGGIVYYGTTIPAAFATGISFSAWWQTPAAWPVTPGILTDLTDIFFTLTNGGNVGVQIELGFAGGFTLHRWPLPPTNSNVHLAMQYDISDGGNTALCWIDGVAQTLSTQSVTSGAFNGGALGVQIHGNSFGANQTAEGALQDFIIWDDVIPGDVFQAAARGAPLANYRRATQVLNLPELRSVVDRSPNNLAMTLTGTAPTRVDNIPGVARARRR